MSARRLVAPGLTMLGFLMPALLVGCTMFKRMEKQTNKAEESRQIEKHLLKEELNSMASSSQSVTLTADSAGRRYVAVIWPKGGFSFSAARGFEGEADSMKMMGIEEESRLDYGYSRDELQLGQQKQESIKEKQQDKKQVEQRQTRQSISWKAVLGLLVLLILSLWLMWKS